MIHQEKKILASIPSSLQKDLLSAESLVEDPETPARPDGQEFRVTPSYRSDLTFTRHAEPAFQRTCSSDRFISASSAIVISMRSEKSFTDAPFCCIDLSYRRD